MDEELDLGAKKIWRRPKFWIIFGGVAVLLVVLFFGGKITGENSVLGSFRGVFFKTFEDVFGIRGEKPIYEFDLTTGEGKGLREEVSLGNKEPKATSESNKNGKNLASVQSAAVNNEVTKPTGTKVTSKKEGSSVAAPAKDEAPVPPPSSLEKNSDPILDCSFPSSGSVVSEQNRKIFFSEIAWMGSGASANDEWIEISGEANLNLNGWQIKNEDESIKILFGNGEKIPTDGFFLLERTDDSSVPNTTADKIYVGALSNESEWLKLFDGQCNLIDEVNASLGWGTFGGENSTKKTLERNQINFGWYTSMIVGGTPRIKNSAAASPQPQPTSTPPQSNPPPSLNPEPEPSPIPVPTEPFGQTQDKQKVLISEVMVGSSESADDEFLEVYNYGSQAVDLTGWTIKKKSSSGNESSLVAAGRLEGRIIQPGKYFLLAHDGGYTGGVAADVLWPASYSLAYTNNTVTIYDASGTLIDQVTWVEIPKDKSYARNSLDISAGFGVSDSPNPQNSQ